jgi:NAD(P)-dependent dehydrogenase (short-subunit alcohol dehydrogenase family)
VKLAGKIALITGARKGIGRGIAEIFSEAGADVIVNDIDPGEQADRLVKQIQKLGRRAMSVKADVTQRVDVEAMFERASSELGPVDILVNNAGIETIVPFLDLTDEQWMRLTDINQHGPWLCSQVFCKRAIAEKRSGSIINVGSIQAGKVLPGRTHYAPAKLALEALTRNMSAEVAPLGIRVNCIHPGYFDTDMTTWLKADQEVLKSVLGQISLGRAGEPRELGMVAAFLASEEASYLTGQSFFVDGGWVGK